MNRQPLAGPTVAIIPARGGSQRLPGKNLAPLDGRPLIAHTIGAAREAKRLDGIYVSTNDHAIAGAARRCGAEVIDRPASLATAEAPTEPALLHAVKAIEQSRRYPRPVGLIVMLQATSPLRSAGRIDEAVALQQRTGCDAVVSVVEDLHYYFCGTIDEEARLRVPYNPARRLRTQEIPRRYRENGAIYVMTRAQLVRRRCRMGGDMRALVMSPAESVDIDGLEDLEYCEWRLRRASAAAAVEAHPRLMALSG